MTAIREPRVLGSRVPTTEPVRILISLDTEAGRALDLAAGVSGLERYEFVCRAVQEAVRAATGETLDDVAAT